MHSADEIQPDPHHILIASHNCESLYPHIQEISQNQLFQKADSITLQETWTHQNVTIHSPLANHTLILQHRQQQDNEQHSYNKGGVGLLFHQDFEYTVIDTSALQIECIAIKISAPPLTIVNIYRPPTYNLNAFCEELSAFSTQLEDPIIMIGDFNVKYLSASNNQLSRTLSEYQQLISTPTTRKRTLIDHIYVKNAKIVHAGVMPTSYSYHDATFVFLAS